LSEIPSIGGPNKTKKTYDSTDLDSTGGYEEFISGFKNSGEVAIPMHFTHDGYKIMNTIFEQKDLYYFKIVLSNDEQTIFDFAAIVTALGSDVPYDEKVTAPVTLKISGRAGVTKGSTTTTTTTT
jgi:predicted secreted protein